jgi:sarcosine oxidase
VGGHGERQLARVGSGDTPWMDRDVDLVVVGGGAMGVAAGWAAAVAGAEVVVLERFGPAHHRGASHGGERIFRHAHEDPVYVEMALAAEDAWTGLEHAIGRTLIHRVGFVEHGDPAELERLAAAADQCGLVTERLSSAEAERRWPTMRFTTDVLHQPGAGWMRAAEALAGLAAQATAHGAELRHEVRVEGVEPVGDHEVRVRTADLGYRAPAVVVTAGAWTTDLLPDFPLPQLTTTEEHVFFVRRKDSGAGAGPGAGPAVLPFLHGGELIRYGLPAVNGLAKVAEHYSGAVTTGDDRTFVTEPERVERIEQYIAQWLPGLVPEVLETTTCLYTSTPTHEFVLDRRGPVVVGAGFSGIGFKYVPEVGRRLAALALG